MNDLFTQEIAIESDSIYLPLLFDSDIEREAIIIAPKRFKSLANLKKPSKGDKQLIEYDGQKFIRSITLQSVVDSYKQLHPEDYSKLRDECLSKYTATESYKEVGISSKLETIVFEVMPYFIKKNKGLDRKKLNEREILTLINERVSIPSNYMKKAEKFLKTEELELTIKNIEENRIEVPAAPNGKVSGSELKSWVYKALEKNILKDEIQILKDLLYQRKEFAQKNRQYIATMLYLKEQGSFKIDNFSVERTGRDSYRLGVYTPDYALKHWDGKVYMFPGCTVTINTDNISNPRVKERYKHPFLADVDSNQEICIMNNNLSSEFNAKNLIRALETGLNTILYGYINKSGFYGYRKLDDEKSNRFNNLKVSRDHPRIVSGEVEIKNDFVKW